MDNQGNQNIPQDFSAEPTPHPPPLKSVKAAKSKVKSSRDPFFFIKNFFASSQNVIGIDIGSSHIKIVQLQKTSKGYMITNCIARAIPQGIKENTAEKKKVVQGFLSEFIADARIKTKLGRIGVWGKGVFIFSLTIPNLNKKDLKGAVSIELKKRLPFQMDISKVIFDFFVTGQSRDEKGTVLQVTCIAVDQLAVDEHLQFLKDINIRPVLVNATPDAIGNLLPYCIENSEKKTIVVLDIGSTVTMLNFYKNRDLVFSREIPVSGEHLSRALAKSFTTPQGAITISVDDAEKLKRNCGIPLEEDAHTEYLTDFGPLRGEQISALYRPTLERLVMEVTRTFNYFIKTFKSENIEELYLTGGSSRTINFDRFLLYNLEGLKKVERLNVLKAVKGWADMTVFKRELVMEQAAPHLAVAFGLCLGNGGRVNLLPVKEKIEQKILFLTSVLRMLFPIILGTLLSFYALQYMNALRYRVLIINTDSAVSRLEPTVRQIKEYQDIKVKLEQRKSLIEKAKGKQPLWSGVLKELTNILPKEVSLQRITVGQGQEGREIHLYGKIYTKFNVDVALSQLVLGLNDSPFFNNVELVTSKPDMYSTIPAADFDIVCRFTY